jgi:hypothetical protein
MNMKKSLVVGIGRFLPCVLILGFQQQLATRAWGAVPDPVFIHGGDWNGDKPPDADPSVNQGENQWEKMTGAVTVAPGDKIWLGVDNNENNGRFKSVNVTLFSAQMTDTSPTLFNLGGWGGGSVGNTQAKEQERCRSASRAKGMQMFGTVISPQPNGEWLRLIANGAGSLDKVEFKWRCTTNDPNRDKKAIINSHGGNAFGGVGATGDTGLSLVTTAQDAALDGGNVMELWFFPDVGIDTSGATELLAPEGSGNWTASFVTVDPYGNSIESGGVRWVTDGAGFVPGTEYTASFDCLTTGADIFSAFEVTASAGLDGDPIDKFFYICPEPSVVPLGLLLALAQWLRSRSHRKSDIG